MSKSSAKPHQEAIIADYRRGDMSVAQISRRYKLSRTVIYTQLKRWGEYDPARAHAFTNRKGFYACWIERYGSEEAERRCAIHTANCTRGARRGKDHHQFGKTAPRGSGFGWKGWYKDHFFRSLKEACYMMTLDAAGLEWQSAEHLSIPYTVEGKPRTYHPDYLVGTHLIEVKPTSLHTTQRVTTKRLAAEAYCKERGWSYELVDVPIDTEAVKMAMEAGLIRFDRDYREQFLTYVSTHNG